jgi:polar amino acid transport system substrate-binding protein
MSDNSDSGVSRRAYLRAVGGGTIVGTTGLAGCVGIGGDGGSDGGDGGSDGGDGGSDGGTITVVAGTAPGFPPFEVKEGGELTGFDVELLESIVESADGLEFDRWREFDFDGLIPALNDDKIDTIAAAMTITDERDESIDFTDPYYSADQAILVREGGSFMPGSLSDLEGRPVGAQSGTTGEGVIEDNVGTANYNSYDSYVLAVEDLVNNNIDAIVLDEPVANTFAAQRDVAVAFVYETGERYGFGVREGDDDLREGLNEGLSTVQEDGTYEQLRNEWFGGDSG